MRVRLAVCTALVLAGFASGCGPTIGDACTVDSDCGNESVCINSKDYAPGGYCSQPCAPGNDQTCPSGSTCVSKIASEDVSGCLLGCDRASDCRPGYACRAGVRGNPNLVCIGEAFR